MPTPSMLDHFRGLLAYETWANAAAIASLETVPAPNRAGPAWDRACRLLPHNQLARRIWLNRIRGEAYESPTEWFPPMTPEQTRTACATVDAAWADFLGALADAGQLEREVRYTSSEGTGYVSLVREILAHVFNHSTYHRGQVARLVKECGGMQASTDHIAMTRRKV